MTLKQYLIAGVIEQAIVLGVILPTTDGLAFLH